MENKLSLPNQFTQCVKLSFSLSSDFWHGVTTFCRQLSPRPLVLLVLQAVRAGQLAVSTSKRIYLGLFLILVVAPLSGVTYQLFDITHIDYAWFYRTYYDFFLVLGPYFCICICLVGATLLLPQDSKAAYFLLFPLALYIGKIIWMIGAETNEEFNAFWQIIPYYFFLTGAIIAFILHITFNWLMSLHFHKREGTIARILGIIDTPGLTDTERITIARQEKQNLKTLKQY